MKDYDAIEFICLGESCRNIIPISVLKIENSKNVVCKKCGKKYIFNEELIGKIKKFEKLIITVREAEDILGNTNVGIHLDGHEVKLPYRLLLTRMNTLLTLDIGGQEFTFRFRVEPLNN